MKRQVMPLSVSEARVLLRFRGGEIVPSSDFSKKLRDDLLADEMIETRVQAGKKRTLWMPRPELLDAYLKNRFGINDLAAFIAMMDDDAASRADLVNVAGDSKLKRVRSFTGFPVNVLSPMECRLNGEPFVLRPQNGAFAFVHDFGRFDIPGDVTVVGIENPTNFVHIAAQAHLFTNIRPLFVSRYPQSTDLRNWLMRIPNRYLHFGDFDFAGLGIYQTEVYRYITDRATFFLPDGLEDCFARFGNSGRYNSQQLHHDTAQNPQPEVQRLIALIHQYKKGVDQEGLIV